MKIKHIESKRGFENWPSYDLVYEWEDIFSKNLNLPIYKPYSIIKKVEYKFASLSNYILLPKNVFRFDMNPLNKVRKSIIPCIIDFYLKDNQLQTFETAYKSCKLVFISSKEVYDKLKSYNINLNLYHLPLSISDKYKNLYDPSKKKYDLVLMGRQNPVLQEYLNKYIKENPNLKYVYREQNEAEFKYYTSDGTCLGDINTREKYISLMSQSKCGLYATPGLDGGENRTNGYNQVTPRFLELIACGCHIISRYPKNPDTVFFELQNFCPSIDSYEQFKECLERSLSNDIDKQKYESYLKKHFTSCRCELFKEALNNL